MRLTYQDSKGVFRLIAEMDSHYLANAIAKIKRQDPADIDADLLASLEAELKRRTDFVTDENLPKINVSAFTNQPDKPLQKPKDEDEF